MPLHPIELAVLDHIEIEGATSRRAVIVDVGANVGEYADEVLRRWPDAILHCFEPGEQASQDLRERVGHAAVIHRCALSDEEGSREFFFDGRADQTASLYKRDLGYKGIGHGHRWEWVNTRRLDSFFDLGVIDLLKLDIEGHELHALVGCGELLTPRWIKNINFEFNECNLASRVFFKDFWDLLVPRGYAISTFPPGNLTDLEQIQNYEPTLEDFASHREFIARAAA